MRENEVVRVREDFEADGILVRKGERGTIISVLPHSKDKPDPYVVELMREPPEVVTVLEGSRLLWPDRWPDWDSPEWRAMMAASDARARAWREAHGFDTCPKCGTMHTCKTLCCRNCSHKAAPVPPEAG
jgi:hypothetical protein